jgi:recombination endonuclease VII
MTNSTRDQDDARERSNARRRFRYEVDPRYRARCLADAKTRRRRATVERRNGISLEDYDAMLARQHGACAVCKHKFDRVLHVDRDPDTGQLGGLLCSGCLERVGGLRHLWKYRHGCYAYLKNWGGEAYARAFLRKLFGRMPDDIATS